MATIVAHVCPDCWGEWRETSAQLISHYGLNPGIPDQRTELRRVMKSSSAWNSHRLTQMNTD